jgi:hypothetical protein
MLDVNWLLASLVWGSIGVGFFVYGKKQQSIVPLIAGVLMVAISYFAETAITMTAYCIGLIAIVYLLYRNGY